MLYLAFNAGDSFFFSSFFSFFCILGFVVVLIN